VSSNDEEIDSELEDVIDDLYVHQNEDKDSELGVKDLNKLKKRLFDPEFQVIEGRYKAITDALRTNILNKFEVFKSSVTHTMTERASFIESFT
jgi:hypothetical protein